MKMISRVALCASFLFTIAVAAQSGPASNGDFQFALTGASGAIQYNVRGQGNTARGEMTFTGTSEISNEDVDGTGAGGSAVTGVSLTMSFDCLRVSGNRAAMSGIVTSSSVPAYVGVRGLLAVEDNGEGVKVSAPDRFTWGVYRPVSNSWTPSDAEVPGDNGAMFTWYVTDAERFDDVPVLSSELQNTSVDCKRFPFGSYAFEDLLHGSGNIQVKP